MPVRTCFFRDPVSFAGRGKLKFHRVSFIKNPLHVPSLSWPFVVAIFMGHDNDDNNVARARHAG